MPAILNKLSIFFIYYVSRDLDNSKIVSHELLIRYLVVKPAYVNAALFNFPFVFSCVR